MSKRITNIFNLLFLTALILLVACGDGGSDSEGIVPPNTSPAETDLVIDEPTPMPTEEPTSIPLPTPTPQLAALVNGQPILLDEYEQELARYESAQVELGNVPSLDDSNHNDLVLDALIERELIQQAAAAQSIIISPDIIDSKMTELRESTSELGDFGDWLEANLWTEEEFQNAIEEELIVEKMVALVTADVPAAMEQAHVRYIQIDNSDLALSILSQLQEGVDFADLAQRYSLDQATAAYGGDLGFFARGSLLVPEVEAAAFDLQPDEVSEIITVNDPDSGLNTYYIIKMIERDPSRMLGADLRYRLLQEAFDIWLEKQETGATIVKFLENEG